MERGAFDVSLVVSKGRVGSVDSQLAGSPFGQARERRGSRHTGKPGIAVGVCISFGFPCFYSPLLGAWYFPTRHCEDLNYMVCDTYCGDQKSNGKCLLCSCHGVREVLGVILLYARRNTFLQYVRILYGFL